MRVWCLWLGDCRRRRPVLLLGLMRYVNSRVYFRLAGRLTCFGIEETPVVEVRHAHLVYATSMHAPAETQAGTEGGWLTSDPHS